ncbi:hypothetical protein SAMN05421788_103333 [Filimonas lacunae]|uniref:MoxR-vWA-beta-propeller ternary system domain-containing protein n=1 Tax=Filimonas lacunae TaxID=477680 RepID=A0A173MKH5_9BACT|nr:hypothetical protein [Filimonas lacunae]BAV07990.1 hypothetical protein FLA_4023 [Filimonas lacunae]SIT07564.1 hypothetical protein SAMN05421788_103333 [Filimonas lacunae]
MEEKKYIAISPDYFWRVSEAGNAIDWWNGSFVATNEYVCEVLGLLSTQGWPPFGALLIALAATGEGARALLLKMEEWRLNTQLEYATEVLDQVDWVSVKTVYMALMDLPPAYKKGAKRLMVMQAIFTYCHNMLSAQKAKSINSRIRLLLIHDVTEIEKIPFRAALRHCEHDFRCIALMARKFANASAIMQKADQMSWPLIGGMPEVPEEDMTSESVSGSFIQQLIAHSRTFQIGALIEYLWSGLRIPVYHPQESELLLGGVQDITNKGNFDKLLTSELANEDMVMLSRLANSEALYLHKEPPPEKDDIIRAIVIDVSLKNWGTPRTLAYAIALAIDRHPKRNTACEIYGVGNTCLALDFSTVDSVVNSLQQMDTSLHAAEGLQLFFKTNAREKKMEVIHISTRHASKHPAVLKVFSEYEHLVSYFITAEASGELILSKNMHKNRREMQRLMLPLQELWEKRQPAKEKPPVRVDVAKREVLPDSPLLYPHFFTGEGVMIGNMATNEVYVIKGNRIFQLDSRHAESPGSKGWRLLPVLLPQGQWEYVMGTFNGNEHILFCIDYSVNDVLLIDLLTGSLYTVKLREEELFAPAFFYENALVITCVDGCVTVDIITRKAAAKKYKRGYDPFAGEENQLQAEEAYRTYQQQVDLLYRVSNKAPLGGLTHVAVNKSGQLLLNNRYVLSLVDVGIKLLEADEEKKQIAITAIRLEKESCFVFPDGSSIAMDDNGMLVLKSKEALGVGFVSAVVHRTEHADRLSLIGKKDRDQKMMHYGSMLNHCPVVLESYNNMDNNAVLFQKEMKQHGIDVVIESNKPEYFLFIPAVVNTSLGVSTTHYFTGNVYYKPSHVSLTRWDPRPFYIRYIDVFIGNIRTLAENVNRG